MQVNINLVILIGIVIVIIAAIYFLVPKSDRQPIHNKGEVEIEIPNQSDLIDDKSSTRDQNSSKQFSQIPPNRLNTEIIPYPQPSNASSDQFADIRGQFEIDTGKQPKLHCYSKESEPLSPQDLMPRDDPYNAWQITSPSVTGHLNDRNFLESGHHFGIDTISNTLKNPSYQLRSDPPIPKVQVGPWMQSTYEPDTNRRFFEIGVGEY